MQLALSGCASCVLTTDLLFRRRLLGERRGARTGRKVVVDARGGLQRRDPCRCRPSNMTSRFGWFQCGCTLSSSPGIRLCWSRIVRFRLGRRCTWCGTSSSPRAGRARAAQVSSPGSLALPSCQYTTLIAPLRGHSADSPAGFLLAACPCEGA